MFGRQAIYVGVDIGKSAHHPRDRRARLCGAQPPHHQRPTCSEIHAHRDSEHVEAELVWAVDLTSELATMALATLLGSGQSVFYVPGRLVNSMSHAFRGEGKTNARDAKVIAETPRLRNDLTLVTAPDELVTALSVLCGARPWRPSWTAQRGMIADQLLRLVRSLPCLLSRSRSVR
jgi:hypothetical protein